MQSLSPGYDILPEFAPLPRPFIQFIFNISEKNFVWNKGNFYVKTRQQHIWYAFLHARHLAHFYTYPFVRQSLSNDWVRLSLPLFDSNSGLPKRIPRKQSLYDWQTRHLLRYQGHGKPDPNSVIALFIMRKLNILQRDWLPSHLEESEPLFYVWGISPENPTPQRYPIPLPITISPKILLYSSWAGVGWTLPGWVNIHNYGSIVWAGFNSSTQHYTLTKEDLDAWSTCFTQKPILRPFPKTIHFRGLHQPSIAYEYQEERLNSFAREMLYTIGEQQLLMHLAQNYESQFPPFIDTMETLL